MVRRLDYDVVIVGLGPAGSSLAYHLRKTGLRVAGLDIVDWNGLWGKPCGDAIGEHHFHENHMPLPEGEALANRVEGIDVYSPSEEVRLRVNGKGFMINRNAYGRRLVEEAEKAGVSIHLKTYVYKPILENGRLVGVAAKKEGEEVIFTGKVIVDATGTSGVIRRRLPKEWPVNEPLKPVDMNVAYRRIVRLKDPVEDPSYIRIYVNQEIAPGGYWWLFPKSEYVANIGLGVQGGRGYPHPKEIYEKKLMKRPDVGGQVEVYADAGAAVPTRRPANTLVWDNFLGIGDNGYTVNPVHGGGMGYAMHAAYHASKAIVDAFEEGDFTRHGPLWSLNIAYMRGLGAKQASLDIFRMYLQELSNEEIEWGLRNGVMRAEDAYETSVTGDLKANLSVLDKAKLLVKLLGRPSMLQELITVSRYMKRVKELYRAYPENPDELSSWVAKVEALYKEYKAKLNINW